MTLRCVVGTEYIQLWPTVVSPKFTVVIGLYIEVRAEQLICIASGRSLWKYP